MTRPWQTLGAVDTPQGRLELRRRGGRDFLITIGGRVLMNSAEHRSEAVLGELVCRGLSRPRPRVLIGGLGMGYTLRAALDALPRGAAVVVAELNPVVVEWCRGPLAESIGDAVDDPRVAVELADVGAVIARAGRAGDDRRFDAIALDLYEGPRAGAAGGDPLFGREALKRMRQALVPAGTLAIWSEAPNRAFEKQLSSAGFAPQRVRAGRGSGHVVYSARAPGRYPSSRKSPRRTRVSSPSGRGSG